MTTITHSFAAKAVAGVTAVVMTLSAFSSFALQANAATDLEELCALASSLGISTPEFDALCAGDSDEGTADAGEYVHHPSIDFEFTRNLYLGSRGNDVMMLQKVLNEDTDTMVATVGAGSPGNETAYFGPATRAAVIKFQVKHDISPAAGYFYPLTRAEMNRMAEGSDDDDDNNGGDVEGDTLEVREGDDIDDDVVFGGQIHVPTTAIEVEAGDDDVMIESITVEVTGSARSDVDSVSVWYDGVILDTDSVDSDDEAELEFDMEVEEGDMEELTFSVTMEDPVSKDGLTFQVEVVEIETDADVDGLPVDGARHEVNDTANQLNTYTMEYDVEESDLRVGDEDEMIATVTFENDNADSEDDSIFVQQFALEQDGTADLDDLDNIYADVDGEEYDGEVSGDYVIFDFGNGIEIEGDDDMDFEIYADIVGGATDGIDFTLDNDDLVDWVIVVDEDDRLLAENNGAAADTNSGGFNITAGTGDSDDSDEVRDGNITPGEDDARMASFELDIEGENVVDGDVEIVFIADYASTSDTDAVELDDITITNEDGDIVATDDDVTLAATTTSISADPNDTEYTITVDFEDVEFEEGDMTYIITADVPDDAPNNMVYRAVSVAFTNFEGEESDEDVTISAITLTTDQTVEGPAISVGVDATLNKDTAETDEDDVELAQILLDTTNSGEAIEVDTISLDFALTDATGSDFDEDDITNCVLQDEDGEDVSDEEDLNATSSQEFDMDSGFAVEKDEVVVLSLVCDLSDDFKTGDDITVTIDTTTANHDFDASESSEDVTITVSPNTGEVIDHSDGSISAQDGDEANMQSVRTGQWVSLGSVELDSDEVEGTLEEVTFTVAGAQYIKSGTKIFVSTDEDGDDVVTSFFKTSNGTHTIDEGDWDQDVEITDGNNELFFWVTTADAVASEAQSITVDIANGSTVYIDGDSYTLGSGSSMTGVKVYSGLATIATEDVSSTDVNTDDVLMKFAITAEGEDIVLASTTGVSVATTGTASVGTSTIYYDNSNYDDAVDGTALTAADLTIDEGDTIYFVVKSSTAVDEGEDDTIRTTVDFDGNISVNGTPIDPVESDVDDFADNAESLVHTYRS